VVSDLDEAAEFAARLVGADLVAVVAVVGGHDVEPDGQFPAAGQCQGPGSVGVPGGAGGEVPVAGRGARARLRRQLVLFTRAGSE